MNTPGTTEMKSGLDPLHTDTQAGLQQPSSVANPEAVFSSSGPVIDHGDRDAFGLRLQQQYHHYAVNDIPFLLIALRGDGETARGLDFSLLYQCVQKLLTNEAIGSAGNQSVLSRDKLAKLKLAVVAGQPSGQTRVIAQRDTPHDAARVGLVAFVTYPDVYMDDGFT